MVVFEKRHSGETEFYLLPLSGDDEGPSERVYEALQAMDGHLLDQFPEGLDEAFDILNSAFASEDSEYAEYPDLTGLMDGYKVDVDEWDDLPVELHEVYYTGLFG